MVNEISGPGLWDQASPSPEVCGPRGGVRVRGWAAGRGMFCMAMCVGLGICDAADMVGVKVRGVLRWCRVVGLSCRVAKYCLEL